MIRRVALALALVALAVYATYLGLLYHYQAAFIYPGVQTRVDDVLPLPPGSQLFSIAAGGARSDALFLPATPGVDRAAQPVVIFTHGNGEVIDLWVSALDGFRERGIGVLLIEYPGYGRSTGSPSEASIRAALDAAYDRLVTDPRVDRVRIFGFGQSLGGGAICLLARDRPLRALILQSTFTSLDGFAAGYGAPAFLLRDHFDSQSAVAHFAGPVLVIHGRNDRLIPFQQGQRLAAASPHATFRLYDCGHGCWDPERLPFWHDAEPFLRAAGILRPPPGKPEP